MRNILLKSISAGPDGVRLPGIHQVPAQEAAALVMANHAEYTDEPTPAPALPTPEEKAVISPAETRGKPGRHRK